MKRIKLLFLAIIASFASLNAQTTFNVRGGFSTITADYHGDMYAGANIGFQANIPINRNERWVVSPTLIAASEFADTFQGSLSIFIGHKIRIANNALFIPKIGPMVGFEANDSRFMAGPSIDLAFEIKHFIVSLNGYYSLCTSGSKGEEPHYSSYYNSLTKQWVNSKYWTYYDHTYHPSAISLSLGYKF